MNATSSLNERTSDRTVIVLSLVGRFDRPSFPSAPEPLTHGEYNALCRVMARSGMTPEDLYEDLLREHTRGRIKTAAERANLDPERVLALVRSKPDTEEYLNRIAKSSTLPLWLVGRGDAMYPLSWKRKLGESAPPVLFGSGDIGALVRTGIAVVGSRDLPQAAVDFAMAVGVQCASSHVAVISGAARGADLLSMEGAVRAGGEAVGILPMGLFDRLNNKIRELLATRRMTLASPFGFQGPFCAAHAYARNKLIHALGIATVVADSQFERGGTWSGVVQSKRAGCLGPLFVRAPESPEDGNAHLIERYGARTWDLHLDPKVQVEPLNRPSPEPMF